MVEKGDIEAVTVEDLVKRAHVSRSYFYRHYRDKYDLLTQIVIKISQNTFNYSEADYHQQIAEWLRLLAANQLLFQTALKYNGQNSIEDSLQKYCEQYLYDLIVAHHPAVVAKQDSFSIQFYAYGMVGITKKWLQEGCLQNSAKLAHQIVGQMPVALQRIIL